MATVLKVLRDKTSDLTEYSFIFLDGEIKTSSSSNVSQAVSLTYPKDSPTDDGEDFVIDLGVKQSLAFEWKLYSTDTERSDGSYTSDVKTYKEMLNYLEDVIGYPGIGTVDYYVTVYDKFRTKKYKCSFEDFSINVDSGIYPSGTLKFKIKKQVE